MATIARMLGRTQDENVAVKAKPEERKRTALGDVTNTAVGAGKTGKALKPHAPLQQETVRAEPVQEPAYAKGDMDASHMQNLHACAEYAVDIYAHLKEREQAHPVVAYMLQQVDITEKMRNILVDWMVEVSHKFKLGEDTLFLTVNVLERYLSTGAQIKRKHLQLVGVTSLLIAAKHEEIYPPDLKDLVRVSDNAYNRYEILDMEVSMLNALKFEITNPQPPHFLSRMVMADKANDEVKFLAGYLTELAMVDYQTHVGLEPSRCAAASYYLAKKVMKATPSWSSKLAVETGYVEADIKPLARKLCTLLQAAPENRLQSVRKKYSSTKYNRISKMIL